MPEDKKAAHTQIDPQVSSRRKWNVADITEAHVQNTNEVPASLNRLHCRISSQWKRKKRIKLVLGQTLTIQCTTPTLPFFFTASIPVFITLVLQHTHTDLRVLALRSISAAAQWAPQEVWNFSTAQKSEMWTLNQSLLLMLSVQVKAVKLAVCKEETRKALCDVVLF